MRSTTVLTNADPGFVSSPDRRSFLEGNAMVDSVARIHSISEELREIKSAHDKAVARLLFLQEVEASSEARDLNHRVRIRISQRLFEEMRRVMGDPQ